MKITIHVVRTLLALLFLWASIAYFFKIGEQPTPPKEVMTYMSGIMSANLLNIAKSLELICAILLLLNVFAPLANVVLFPISINILLFHAYLGPKEILMPIIIVLVQLFLAYVYRKNYAGLFATKPLS